MKIAEFVPKEEARPALYNRGSLYIWSYVHGFLMSSAEEGQVAIQQACCNMCRLQRRMQASAAAATLIITHPYSSLDAAKSHGMQTILYMMGLIMNGS